jgi:glycosyl transferase family 25
MNKQFILLLLLLLLCLIIFLFSRFLWWLYKKNTFYYNNNFDNNNKLNYILLNDKKIYTYYINLEHRKDRKKNTLRELKSFGIHNPNKFDAIKEDIGAIGCSKSHLEVLKIARKKNLPYVLIFEDDVKFLNPNVTNKTLNNVLNSGIDWDVIILGGNNYQPYTKINEDCVKVNNCQTTTAYLVKQSYYDTLINNWEDGLSKLIETKDEPKYALDQYWKILQKRDTFLLLTPLNVVQRESYSDILGTNVDYHELMTKHE